VVATPAAWLNTLALGFSYISAETTNWLATVFIDHIDAIATRCRIEPGILLGRTVAHEVGHLLLGTNEHPPHGLMRAHWADTSLTRNVPADFLFSRGDAETIRGHIQARSHMPALAGEDLPVMVAEVSTAAAP